MLAVHSDAAWALHLGEKAPWTSDTSSDADTA